MRIIFVAGLAVAILEGFLFIGFLVFVVSLVRAIALAVVQLYLLLTFLYYSTVVVCAFIPVIVFILLHTPKMYRMYDFSNLNRSLYRLFDNRSVSNAYLTHQNRSVYIFETTKPNHMYT